MWVHVFSNNALIDILGSCIFFLLLNFDFFVCVVRMCVKEWLVSCITSVVDHGFQSWINWVEISSALGSIFWGGYARRIKISLDSSNDRYGVIKPFLSSTEPWAQLGQSLLEWSIVVSDMVTPEIPLVLYGLVANLAHDFYAIGVHVQNVLKKN